MDRAEEAEVAARKATEIEPDNADAHVVLGKALAALGNKEDAAAAFHRALALDPHSGEATTGLKNLGLEAEARSASTDAEVQAAVCPNAQ